MAAIPGEENRTETAYEDVYLFERASVSRSGHYGK